MNSQLTQTNANIPAGRTMQGGSELSLRVLASAKGVDALADTPIALSDGRRAKLSELAYVSDGHAEIRSRARLDGREVVGFNVFRAKGSSDTEVAKGVEVDVAGELLPNWSVVVNYAYTNAKITKTATGTERDLGTQRPNTPLHAGNIWTKYILRHGTLRNLGFGIGVNANSERYGQVGKRANTIVYPAYAILNAALFYRVKSLQLQLNADNLLNKTYWVGGYDKLRSFPSSPLFVKATATYRF